MIMCAMLAPQSADIYIDVYSDLYGQSHVHDAIKPISLSLNENLSLCLYIFRTKA